MKIKEKENEIQLLKIDFEKKVSEEKTKADNAQTSVKKIKDDSQRKCSLLKTEVFY